MTEVDVAKLRPLLANSCDEQAHATMNRNLNRVVEINVGLVNDLVAVRDERDEVIARAECAEAAIERAKSKHRKMTDDDEPYCLTCYQSPYGHAPWPCPTVAALDTGREKSDE
ncbi:hypothetical protein [Leucobacter sp. 1207-22]|uniref:hypothetical protein n=1 Tax=Leucobacter sp. 1207-22 TaxID=2604456 RepID=UPI0040629FDC